MTPERAKLLLGRIGEYGADVEQVLQKLNQVYELSIASTEERINPRLEEPVEVMVRNLAVARAAAMDIWAINRELNRIAQTPSTESSGMELKYELIKNFITADEDWAP